MDHVNKIILSALSTSLLAATVATASTPATTEQPMEKCYGIVKAGMNDCQTAKQSCASSATQDRQPDAFLFLPKGLCQKIVGGELTAKPSEAK